MGGGAGGAGIDVPKSLSDARLLYVLKMHHRPCQSAPNLTFGTSVTFFIVLTFNRM